MAARPASTDWSAHRAALAAGRVLRVVNFHNTTDAAADDVRAELAWWADRTVGIDLADLEGFFAAGRWPDDRPRFVPVFYEGYANHARVAAPVCESLGLTGWFAVCTGFVTCPRDQQELFARSHFIAVSAAETDGRRLALTPGELADVSRRHVVFPHTASHDGIAETTTDADLDREVRAPLAALREWTSGRAAPVFAWMGGTPWGTAPRHDAAVLAAGHRYVVSNTMVQRIA